MVCRCSLTYRRLKVAMCGRRAGRRAEGEIILVLAIGRVDFRFSGAVCPHRFASVSCWVGETRRRVCLHASEHTVRHGWWTPDAAVQTPGNKFVGWLDGVVTCVWSLGHRFARPTEAGGLALHAPAIGEQLVRRRLRGGLLGLGALANEGEEGPGPGTGEDGLPGGLLRHPVQGGRTSLGDTALMAAFSRLADEGGQADVGAELIDIFEEGDVAGFAHNGYRADVPDAGDRFHQADVAHQEDVGLGHLVNRLLGIPHIALKRDDVIELLLGYKPVHCAQLRLHHEQPLLHSVAGESVGWRNISHRQPLISPQRAKSCARWRSVFALRLVCVRTAAGSARCSAQPAHTPATIITARSPRFPTPPGRMNQNTPRLVSGSWSPAPSALSSLRFHPAPLRLILPCADPLRSSPPSSFSPFTQFRSARIHAKGNIAFTLLELLVSLVILVILTSLVFSITGGVGRMWKETSGALGEWRAARAAFETMNRRISQATLNTTWAYFDGPNGTGNLTTTTPVSYGRYSDLQFVCGNSAEILDSVPNTVTQAIFFQAPLGETRNAGLRGLPQLLNACGFYVQFNDDVAFRPAGGIFQNIEHKYRFRLMELLQPSEDLSVYANNSATDFQWFKNPIANGVARPLAENIIALCILPKFSKFDTSVGSILAPNFYYNSRIAYSFKDGSFKGNTLHQLPPLLQIIMVALDENSAKRLSSEFGTSMPSSLFDNVSFKNADDCNKDLAQLEKNLINKKLRYRIFSSVVSIRGAKWSGD